MSDFKYFYLDISYTGCLTEVIEAMVEAVRDQYDQRIEGLTDHIESLEEEVDNLEQEISTLEQDIDSLEEEVERLKTLVEVMESRNSDF